MFQILRIYKVHIQPMYTNDKVVFTFKTLFFKTKLRHLCTLVSISLFEYLSFHLFRLIAIALRFNLKSPTSNSTFLYS